jgi:hypothetical protein
METVENQQKEQQKMKNGTETKPLYIKHLSLGDWELIEKLKLQFGNCSNAEMVRMMIRKTAGIM